MRDFKSCAELLIVTNVAAGAAQRCCSTVLLNGVGVLLYSSDRLVDKAMFR